MKKNSPNREREKSLSKPRIRTISGRRRKRRNKTLSPKINLFQRTLKTMRPRDHHILIRIALIYEEWLQGINESFNIELARSKKCVLTKDLLNIVKGYLYGGSCRVRGSPAQMSGSRCCECAGHHQKTQKNRSFPCDSLSLNFWPPRLLKQLWDIGQLASFPHAQGCSPACFSFLFLCRFIDVVPSRFRRIRHG